MHKRVAYAVVALAIIAAPPLAVRLHAALGDCGQPASTGATPLATDALFTLRAAVGSETCEPCVCDVDDNGAITASDAQRVLRFAVGQPQELDCPACGPPACGGAEAPECGGTCAEGFTCRPQPGDPGQCECLDPCQASDAPACGGGCELAGDPDLACQATVELTGSPAFEFCQCLPVGIRACANADAPACGGACGPGTLCGNDGGACVCAALATQPSCAQADAPACAGTCGSETICAADGDGGCACVPLAGHEETCASQNAPACSGTCASGNTCAVNIDFSCNCFSPCELGDAPGCGGTCFDASKSCVAATATVGDHSIDFCACR